MEGSTTNEEFLRLTTLWKIINADDVDFQTQLIACSNSMTCGLTLSKNMGVLSNHSNQRFFRDKSIKRLHTWANNEWRAAHSSFSYLSRDPITNRNSDSPATATYLASHANGESKNDRREIGSTTSTTGWTNGATSTSGRPNLKWSTLNRTVLTSGILTGSVRLCGWFPSSHTSDGCG